VTRAPPVLLPADHVKLTVVYDNNAGDNHELNAAWGFACVVETGEHTILFDAGADPDVLTSNMTSMGVDPYRIDAVFLSHDHDDHVGGIAAVRPGTSVYILPTFAPSVRQTIEQRGFRVVDVVAPREICPGLVLTGAVTGEGRIKEQALLVITEQGDIAVVGCAHPGILNILKRAQEITGRHISAVIGGLHTFRESQDALTATVESMQAAGVRFIAPCHCSGDAVRNLCEQGVEWQYVAASVGTVITAPLLK